MKIFDLESFQADLRELLSKFDTSEGSVSEVADKYNTILETTLEKHAPLTKKTVTVRPQPKWYNDDIHEARKEKRKAEKVWRKTRLTIHQEIYKEKKLKVVHMIKSSKADFYRGRLDKP